MRLAGVQVSVASECCKLLVSGVTFESNNGRNETTFLSEPLTECAQVIPGTYTTLLIDI